MQVADPAAHRPEIKALTSLRGIAAMAVVLQHFSATAQDHAAGWIPSIVPHGYMAVDFFFVLSGFIMAYTYLDGFHAMGWRAYGPFLWKRVARIFPLGIAVTAAVLVAGAIAASLGQPSLFVSPDVIDHGLGLAIAINLLHLQGFVAGYTLNGPSFSVSLELGAYVIFPILIALVFARTRAAPIATLLVCVAALIWIERAVPGGLGSRQVATDCLRCIAEFSLGLVVYRAYRQMPSLHWIGSDAAATTVSVIAVAALFLRSDLAAALDFPLIVLAFALNRGAPSRLLATRVPYFLGLISFSIYLIHNMFRAPELLLVRTLHPAPLPQVAALLFAAFGALSVIPFATLAYYGVERPGRTLLNGIVRRTARAPVPSRI